MSGVGQAVFMNQRSFVTLPDIGSVYEGGFFAGQISTAGNGTADYNLVIGPLSTAHSTLQWKNVSTPTPGAVSDIDGPQNTADMVADGSATIYPSAHFCNNLTVGGFSDWYFAAKNELDVCYFNLKPTTGNNTTSSGINPNAVPARASNYTTGNPAQTSAAAFQSGNSEAFANGDYWSSTAISSSSGGARKQFFSDGYQPSYYISKSSNVRVRAVRRVAV